MRLSAQVFSRESPSPRVRRSCEPKRRCAVLQVDLKVVNFPDDSRAGGPAKRNHHHEDRGYFWDITLYIVEHE